MKNKGTVQALCLALTLLLLAGCGGGIDQYEQDAAATDAASEPTATAEPEPTATAAPGLGYAAYEPDMVVAVCDGQDITWREYYYWLNYYAGYIDYMTARACFSARTSSSRGWPVA